MGSKDDKSDHGKLIAENRRARFDYFLDETVEAGLVLTGRRPRRHSRHT